MKVEVLVTTMHCRDFAALYKKMHIKGDAVIANQCDNINESILNISGNNVICVSTDKRGLSLNRNTAISRSKGDILVVGDDDVTYVDDYCDVIASAYERFPDADIILFDVPSVDNNRKTFELKKTKILTFNEIVRFGGVQITYRREIINNGILFNEMFGSGNSYFRYSCGEDTLFLSEAYQKKHKIIYVKEKIGYVNNEVSTWKDKEWSPEFFYGHGALYTAISSTKSILFIFYYAMEKFPFYRGKISMFNAITEMMRGRKKYYDITRHKD